MTPIPLRPARVADAPFIRELLRQLGYPDFDETQVAEKITLHQQEGYQMLVAEINSEVIGFISLHWFELAHWRGRLGRITSFCVEENFRSRGVGSQMLEAAEKILLEKNCVKFEVTSNQRRKDAHAFYLKAGYVEDSRRFVKYPATR